jgi:hypothetical protein
MGDSVRFRRTLTVAAALAAALPAASAAAPPPFGGPVTWSAGVSAPEGSPRSVAAGDLNRDGAPDLVVGGDRAAGRTRNAVAVLLGRGDGGFLPAVRIAVPDPSEAVAVADLNRDARPDVIVTSPLARSITVLLGKGDGSFQTPAPRRVDTQSTPITGDLDLDGDVDLVTTVGGGKVGVLLNDGAGRFPTVLTASVAGVAASVTLAEMNGDAVLDLIVAADGAPGQAATAFTLLGKGDGTFLPAVGQNLGTPAGITGVARVSAADLNRDARTDVVVANATTDTVAVLLGEGDGRLRAPIVLPAGSAPVDIAIGDLDRDGRPDLALANASTDIVALLMGNGDGTFQVPVGIPAGSQPLDMALADLDGDARLDLAVADSGSGQVAVLSNTRSRLMLGQLRADPTSFRTRAVENCQRACPPATQLDFSLSGPAQVRVTVRSGRRTVRSFTIRGVQGPNRIGFSGLATSGPLPPGRYDITLRAYRRGVISLPVATPVTITP